ncbi:hypothetical protein BS78_K202600 [Paspalum vaginatum]|uniref:Uncharacterized protein n=1 Tax=Paspalum vaginatum TaxID=158149 RepID=A0A9W7XBI3_9POAL|nr:hypothetical protein BS78_K202600 [Paspalum vaginatum]
MESSSSIGQQRQWNVPVLPLIICNRCNSRKVMALKAKTPMNTSSRHTSVFHVSDDFAICRQRDGSGCEFWHWEDEYEQYLIDNELVPLNYKRLFSQLEKMKMKAHAPAAAGGSGKDGDKEHDGLIMKKMDVIVGLLSEVVVLLKILLVFAVRSTMY